MDFEKLFSKTKNLMTTPGWHNNKWSDKCEVFFATYREIIEACHPIENILNIGVGPNLEAKTWNTFLNEIFPSVKRFHNLEISKTNADRAMKNNDDLVRHATVGDVRYLDEYFDNNSFDLIFWNQGPEHIYREEWEDCFRRLKNVANKAIYICCPWGSGYDQDKWHFAKSIYEGEFEQFGFKCRYHGKVDSRDAGIVGHIII